MAAIVLGHDGEDGKWLLTTYSDDEVSSQVGYVSMSGNRCPANDSCENNTDEYDLSEKESTGQGCVVDRDAYLKTVFKGAPYLRIERYSTNCHDDYESYDIVGYLADDNCHPDKFGSSRLLRMKTAPHRLLHVVLGLLGASRASSAAERAEAHVRVNEVNESPSCEARTTAMFSTIVQAPCTAETQCTKESGATGNSSLYAFCSYSQAEYLEYAYGGAFYVLLERYKGSNCDHLSSTDVFRADGKCHNSLQYALQVVLASNGEVAIKSRTQTCESGEWGDLIDLVPNEKVNTGVCFPIESRSGKLYLVDGTNGTSASTSSSGSVSDTNTTLDLLSSASALPALPSSLLFSSSLMLLVTGVA
ncbi:hypothetical protein PHYPSEUDO_000705 [Phytophthora pseudosyringae]|uniref:Uncharacterized protein n=1 Tax=Phytophthora pseudosyringae TaxID=221518 RepID=A0A8T1VXG9_9STRA|nr:hypothetical protein PHYPSEUDO_000705 [Phytophthora pseudosyringae]